MAELKVLEQKNVATWTNRDKSLSVQIAYSTLDELVLEIYRLNMLNDLGDIKTDQDLFKALQQIGNVDAVKNEPCGKCGSHNIGFRVREVEGNFYYEKVCTDCWAKLGFGSHKKPAGSLFGKRKDETGKRLADNGWLKYDKDTGTSS